MRVGGLDPSLSGTALTLHVGVKSETYEWPTKYVGNTIEERNERYAKILRPARELLRANPLDLMVIEGHPPGGVDGKAFDRSELRGQIMLALKPHVGRWVEVSPVDLKQYTAHAGNADKPRMGQAVFERWGRRFDTDNKVDSYALWQMGCELARYRDRDGHLQQYVKALVDQEKKAEEQRRKASQRQLWLGGSR